MPPKSLILSNLNLLLLLQPPPPSLSFPSTTTNHPLSLPLKLSNPRNNHSVHAITTTNPPPLSNPETHETHEGIHGGAHAICFPSLAWANMLCFSSRNYNVEVIVAEDESEDSLLRRFKREVMKAGIIPECRRRRFFENKVEKKKRKARDAARKNRRRPYVPKAKWNNREEQKKKKEEVEEEDNWELPEGELPY